MSYAETTPLEHVNEIDIPTLVDLIDADAAQTRVTAKVVTTWRGALLTETDVAGPEPLTDYPDRGPRRFGTDAPRGRLGYGAGPSPTDYLLGSLASSLVWAYVTQAAVRGVELAGVRVVAEAEVALKVFLGLQGSAHPLDTLVLEVELDCDVEPELRTQLHRAVEKACSAQLGLARATLLLTGEEQTERQSNAA
jgi:uncharacterized OsmC-like protein